MIVFDLGCGNGHVFEAWFGSSEDYESQRTRGLVTCPICNSAQVEKAVMAPRVGRKGNQQTLPAVAKGKAVPMSSDEPAPEQVKEMLRVLAETQAAMLKKSDWVGDRFADEARSMHLGDTEHRAIYGQTTPEQAKSLIEDGVPVAPLPFPVRPPGADN
ncbi:MAG: DUF1178 family protein [Sphingomonadaceae bacterium]